MITMEIIVPIGASIRSLGHAVGRLANLRHIRERLRTLRENITFKGSTVLIKRISQFKRNGQRAQVAVCVVDGVS